MNRHLSAVALLLWIAGGTVGAFGQARPRQAIDGLDWMAGCWRDQEPTHRIDECWMAPLGGVMLGVTRTVASRTSFEFLRIADDGDGLAYFASPSGRPATPFHLVETGDQRVVFANPEHDFPQRVIYWREGDRLRARVEGEEDGELHGIDFTWDKVAPAW
jgi:Domain of unknown function (DUF6265)